MKSLSKLILCLLWWGFITASGTFRQSIKNACLSVHHSQDAAFHQVYWDKFLTEDDTAWLSAEIHATYSEVEARSKKGRIHPLSKEPFLVHYVESFIHTEVLPAMNRRYGFTERLLGIKDIYFEIQSFGVKRARESLVAASKKNSGDLTFVLLLNNTNAGSGNVQIFNMSTVREDSYLYDVDDSQHLLFDNEGQIISDEHAPEEIPLFDHETITSLDQKCLENCEECEACNGLMKPEYGPLYPVDESSVVNVQLSAGEGVFFPAQRYYRISPVHWTNGTDPIIYLVGIISIATDTACANVLRANKTQTMGEVAMAAGSASQTVILAVVFCFLIVVGSVMALVDRFNNSGKRKRY